MPLKRKALTRRWHWKRGGQPACKAQSQKFESDPRNVDCANCRSFLEGRMILHPDSGELVPGWKHELDALDRSK